MPNRTNPRMAAPFRDAQTRGKGTEKASHPIFIRPDAFMGLLFMVRNARTIMEFEYAYYTSLWQLSIILRGSRMGYIA